MQNRLTVILMLCLLFAAGTASGQHTVDSSSGDGFRRFHYPNGRISSEGFIVNGQPDGYWKAYYESGILKSEGNRKNFKLDSLWKFYDPDGKLIVEIRYREGKKNGIKTTWLDRETVSENFRDDVKEGYTRYYYPDGKLRQDIPFDRGVEQGFGREYGPDGTIITLTEYKKGFIVDRLRINRKDGSGRRQGKWYTFYERGSLKTEVNYKDGLKNGYLKEYAENGDLLKIVKYANDEIVPEAEEIRKLDVENEYYPNGRIRISAMFRNGVPEGVRREYDTAGRVERAVIYRSGIVVSEGIVLDDGNRTGPWKDFYPDGSLRSEGRYDNGKQTGVWKYYHANGKTEQTGVYNSQGKPEGTWKWFYEDGKLLKEESYRKGLRDGLSTEYDETGKVVTEGEFADGLEEGPWFEVIGDTYVRGSYREGMRTGLWEYFYIDRNGERTDSLCFYRGSYIDDNPDGKHTWYWETGALKNEGSYVNGRKEGDWLLYNSDGTLFMVITYREGVETRFDGVKIKPPFEKEEE